MKTIIISVILIVLSSPLTAFESKNIDTLLAREKNSTHKKNIKQITRQLTARYDSLYEKLKEGKKITVFMDPAHGILASGKWQGDVTWRQSTIGLPEEYYATPLARELYKNFKTNPHIRVVTTKDFMAVLRGEQEQYKNIGFTKTIQYAKSVDAFIIVSSHLNNISPIHKAEGRVNLFGIHVTCDNNGVRYISNIKSVQRGFLTLYNKFDATGFSRTYAENIKGELTGIGMYPNEWDDSVVADDRFSYFSSYPLSVIYETGFISNPIEEKFLKIKHNQELIGKGQYTAFVESLRSSFGVDISQEEVKLVHEQPDSLLEKMIASRIAVYYIKKGEHSKAIYACNMVARLNSDDQRTANYYSSLASKLKKSQYYMNLANKYKKRNKSKYSKYSLKAARKLGGRHIFSSMKSTIYATRRTVLGLKPSTPGKSAGYRYGAPPKFSPLPVAKEKHTLGTPFLLTLKPGQTLKEAIDASIAPNEELKKKIYKSFSDVKVTKTKWVRLYSKKKKKYYWKKRRYQIKKTFNSGIYVVKISKNYQVVSVKNVRRVRFDPSKYQNQEYFKNSCLTETLKDKSL